MQRALLSLGKDELKDMLAQQGGAEVGCSFCNKKQVFTAEELQSLIDILETREA